MGIALAGLGCALLLMQAVASASITRSRLRDGLAHQMRGAGGASGAWVIDVDAPGDRALFGWASHTHRILASNTKLFTTAAVVDRFGAERRLETRLYTRRPDAVHGRTLRGSLVIVGAGDPVLAGAGFARRHGLPLTPLGDLARDVREAGVRRVTGDIRADNTIFDRRRGVPTTGVDASGELCSLSGLSYDSGFIRGHCAKSPELVAARVLRRKLGGSGLSRSDRASPRQVDGCWRG